MQKPYLVTTTKSRFIIRAGSRNDAAMHADPYREGILRVSPIIPERHQPPRPSLPEGVTISPSVAMERLRKLKEQREEAEYQLAINRGRKAFCNGLPSHELSETELLGYRMQEREFNREMKA